MADVPGMLTRMAKPDETEAGSSCHVHLSLEADGTNAFHGDQPVGPVLDVRG